MPPTAPTTAPTRSARARYVLTTTQVKSARPRAKVYKLFDGAGLYLEVTPSGARYWRLKYRIHGRERRLALGVYPDVSLAEARHRCDAARRQIAEGLDPVAQKRVVHLRARLADQASFEAVARDWLAVRSERWKPGHRASVTASLEANVFPTLGRRPVNEITAQEILLVLRAVERRGALDVASRVLQRITAVIRYAVQTGLASTNPATELRGVLRTRKVRHRAALSYDELPEFLQRLDAADCHFATKLALRLLLLTFVRPGELRLARWEEFNEERAEWRIPAERMKMGAPHLVPLSRQAVAVLQELRTLTGRHDLVLSSQNDTEKPLSANTLLFALYRMGYHGRATAHGFRALASTTLNEMGFDADVIERQLAHAERNKVRAAYHRSEYLPDRRKLMQAWADLVDKAAGRVRPLRRRQKARAP